MIHLRVNWDGRGFHHVGQHAEAAAGTLCEAIYLNVGILKRPLATACVSLFRTSFAAMRKLPAEVNFCM